MIVFSPIVDKEKPLLFRVILQLVSTTGKLSLFMLLEVMETLGLPISEGLPLESFGKIVFSKITSMANKQRIWEITYIRKLLGFKFKILISPFTV